MRQAEIAARDDEPIACFPSTTSKPPIAFSFISGRVRVHASPSKSFIYYARTYTPVYTTQLKYIISSFVCNIALSDHDPDNPQAAKEAQSAAPYNAPPKEDQLLVHPVLALNYGVAYGGINKRPDTGNEEYCPILLP